MESLTATPTNSLTRQESSGGEISAFGDRTWFVLTPDTVWRQLSHISSEWSGAASCSINMTTTTLYNLEIARCHNYYIAWTDLDRSGSSNPLLTLIHNIGGGQAGYYLNNYLDDHQDEDILEGQVWGGSKGDHASLFLKTKAGWHRLEQWREDRKNNIKVTKDKAPPDKAVKMTLHQGVQVKALEALKPFLGTEYGNKDNCVSCALRTSKVLGPVNDEVNRVLRGVLTKATMIRDKSHVDAEFDQDSNSRAGQEHKVQEHKRD